MPGKNRVVELLVLSIDTGQGLGVQERLETIGILAAHGIDKALGKHLGVFRVIRLSAASQREDDHPRGYEQASQCSLHPSLPSCRMSPAVKSGAHWFPGKDIPCGAPWPERRSRRSAGRRPSTPCRYPPRCRPKSRRSPPPPREDHAPR